MMARLAKKYSIMRRRVHKRTAAHHYYAIRAGKSSVCSTVRPTHGYIKQTHAGLPVKKGVIRGKAPSSALETERPWLASQH
jgi:hypothetical protein